MIKEVLSSENRSQLGGHRFDTRMDIKYQNGGKSKAAGADIHPPASNEPER
jgi:hypothetical protein